MSQHGKHETSRREFLRTVTVVGGSVAAGVSSGRPVRAAGKAVKIGAPMPLTGAYAEQGINSLHGVELAVGAINAAGGIKSMGGATIELVSGDTGTTDPNQAASVVRRLVEGGCVALVGCYLSNLTLQGSTAAERAQVPMLTQSFTDAITSRGYKYIFQLPPKSSHFGSATVQYLTELAKGHGAAKKRTANVYPSDAAGKAAGEVIAKDIPPTGAFELVVNEMYPFGLNDASTLAAKVASAKSQLVITGGNLADMTLLVRAFRAAGYDGPIVTQGGGAPLGKAFGQTLGKNAEGVIALAAWAWDMKYPGTADINKAFTSKYQEPFMPQEAGECYVATFIIRDALEKTASAEPSKIRDAISSMEFTKGPASLMPGGKVKFDATGMNQHVYPLAEQWQGGILKTIWPASDQIVKPIFGANWS
jgi:branched-chain amino acid transport system substrate-binding protein